MQVKEGWTSLHKTIREINLVFKGCLSGRKELHDLHRTSSVEVTALSSIPTR